VINNSFTFGNAALKIPPDLSALPSSIRFTDGERRVFRSREIDPRTGRPLTVSQWAERYRMVTDGDFKGRWQNVNSPYATEIMDLWTNPYIREIYVCAAPQIVKTQIAFNCMFYAIDQDPGGIMYVMPDEKTAKRIAKTRILSTIRATPRIAELLTPRSDDATTLAIRFKNGADLMMAWATSAAEISSEPRRYLIGDEVSKFPSYASGQNKREPSPIDLMRARANSFPHSSKALFISSPGEAPCAITDLMRYDADEVRRYEVPCPICGHRQIMDDEHIILKRTIKDPRLIIQENLAYYSCDKCKMLWNDYARRRAVERGRWISGKFNDDGEWVRIDPVTRPVAVAFHLPSWYGVILPLSHKNGPAVARMRAEDNPEKKKVYITQHKAEEFKEVIPTKKEEALLAEHRTMLPADIVPTGAIALIIGIDSHTWGYRFVLYACIPNDLGFTLQKIRHGLLGSLADVEAFVYHARFQVENSTNTMGIWRAAIDTGGNKPGPNANNAEKSMTDEVYEWLRKQPEGTIYGVKGASHKHAQGPRVKIATIDKYPHSNKPIPGGLEIRIIDVDQFKELFHWRLTRSEEETQRILFDADTDNDFIRELLAEERRITRGRKQEWVRVRTANHYLDCTVYAMAAMDAEWQPSLAVMQAAIKAARTKQTQSTSSRARNKTNETSADYSRPDMDSIREGFLDRFER
jgi:phage terminase large subunit GpA-like protein